MNASDISEKVLTEMITADKDAVWIIQSWQGNPTTALLNGLDRVEKGTDHALILDLYAEKDRIMMKDVPARKHMETRKNLTRLRGCSVC